MRYELSEIAAPALAFAEGEGVNFAKAARACLKSHDRKASAKNVSIVVKKMKQLKEEQLGAEDWYRGNRNRYAEAKAKTCEPPHTVSIIHDLELEAKLAARKPWYTNM